MTLFLIVVVAGLIVVSLPPLAAVVVMAIAALWLNHINKNKEE